MEKKFRKPVFRKPLVTHREFGDKTHEADKLLQFKNRDDLTVRETTLEAIRGHADAPEMSIVEAAQLTKRLFDELRTEYGVNCPVQFVVAKNEKGKECLYSMVEKVTPARPFAKMWRKQKQLYVEARYRMRDNALLYYEEKLPAKEPFLGDIIKTSQYVYGRREGDQEDHFYLVDADPFIFMGEIPKDLAPKVLMHFEYELVEDTNKYGRYKNFWPLLERWIALRHQSGIDEMN